MTIEKCELQADGSYHAIINTVDHFIQSNDPEALERFGITE